LALAVPLSRFTPRVGGGSAFFVRHHYTFMNDKAFVYTYATSAGTFRIQPHRDKFALFIDYPQGDWDLKTTCVSVADGIEYVKHQDTGVSAWDDLPCVPENVGRIEAWQQRPFRHRPA
jgi:hypothetical protein